MNETWYQDQLDAKDIRIDKLVARVEELEGALREARKELLRNEIGHPRFAVFAALAVINRVLEGTE